jgi:hypothetical protein
MADFSIERASRWVALESALNDACEALDINLRKRCIAFLSTIDDPLERTRVATALFGKRWRELTGLEP